MQEDDLWVESLIIRYKRRFNLAVDGKKMLNDMHCVYMKGNFDWQREKLTEQQYNQLKKAGIPIEDVEVTGSFYGVKIYNYGDLCHSTTTSATNYSITFRKDGIIPPK